MQQPAISIILPVHDVAPFVGEALQSVLEQRDADYELIAVDDGSRDATGAVLESYRTPFARAGRRLVVHRREQGGAGAARNDAIERARGRLLCFLDADDRFHPGALARLRDAIDADPACRIVFPLCRHVDERGSSTGVTSHPDKAAYQARDLLFDNPIHTGSGVTVRRVRAEEAGQFDTAMPACIDLDYWVRIAGEGPETIRVLPQVLVDYRTRPGQITGDWRRMRDGWQMLCARAERHGLGLAPGDRDAALARNALTWATAAYKQGDHAAARRLVRTVWRRDPAFALADGHARIRTLASLATLLPATWHERLRRRANAR